MDGYVDFSSSDLELSESISSDGGTLVPTDEDYYIWNSNFNTFGIAILFAVGALCGILAMNILWRKAD